MIKSKLNFRQDFLLLAFGNVIKIILTIIATRLVTFYLDYQNFANFILTISIYNFFSLATISPLGPYILTNASNFFEQKTLYSFYSKLFFKYIVPISIFSGVLLLSYNALWENSLNIIYLIPAIILLLIFKSSFEIINQYFNLLKKNLLFISFTLSTLFLNILFGVLFVNFFGNNFYSWLYGFVISNILCYFTAFLFFRNYYKKASNQEFKYNSEIFKFSSQILFINIIAWCIYDGSKFIGEYLFDKADLGILLLGMALSAQIFSTLEGFISQLILPWLFDNIALKNSKEKFHKFQKYFKIVIPVFLLLLTITIIASDLILSILIDESKINKGLKSIFIIGLFIEVIKVFINSIKNIFFVKLEAKILIVSYFFGTIVFAALIYLNNQNITIYSFIKYLLVGYVISFCILFLYTIKSSFKWLNQQ